MSHFSVMVVGSPEEVAARLAPFHEFECTGEDDAYVQDLDITERVRAEYAATKVDRLLDPEGRYHDPDDERFWRPVPEPGFAPEGAGSADAVLSELAGGLAAAGAQMTAVEAATGEVRRSRRNPETGAPELVERFVPDGWSRVEVTPAEVDFFAEWVNGHYGYEAVPHGATPDLAGRHKYGYYRLGPDGATVEQVVSRTNPDSKWDWWVVGGRFQGTLVLREGATGDPGEASVLAVMAGDAERPGPRDASSARKGDVDWEGMRERAAQRAGEEWDKVAAVTGGARWDPWEVVRERHVTGTHPDGSKSYDLDAARREYADQPPIRALRSGPEFYMEPDEFLAPRDAFVAEARAGACATYAFVGADGVWHQRGEMGWFGLSSGDQPWPEWCRRFEELLAAVPDDERVTIVDCHI